MARWAEKLRAAGATGLAADQADAAELILSGALASPGEAALTR